MSEVKPDLIVLDVMMEDISAGFRFAKELRETEGPQGRHTPVITVSAVDNLTDLKFKDRTGTPALPVEAFLEKPVAPEVLLEKIEEMLGRGTSP